AVYQHGDLSPEHVVDGEVDGLRVRERKRERGRTPRRVGGRSVKGNAGRLRQQLVRRQQEEGLVGGRRVGDDLSFRGAPDEGERHRLLLPRREVEGADAEDGPHVHRGGGGGWIVV